MTTDEATTPSVARGPADDSAEALIRDRFDDLMRVWPGLASYLGIHAFDAQLPDMSRAALEGQIAAERRFLADLDVLDAERLSPRMAFESDLAAHAARKRLFELDVRRGWERHAAAAEDIGDALFVLLARDFATLEERLDSMVARLEAAPTALLSSRDRLGDRPVRLWNEMELATAGDLPILIDEIEVAARGVWAQDGPDMRRLVTAAASTKAALEDHARWLEGRLANAVEETALGSEAFDTLVSLRAFDGLSTDEILEIGREQLAAQHDARAAAGRELDPDLDEAAALDRVKSDGPADFDEAMDAYRSSAERARDFVERSGVATIPDDELLEIIPTPAYLRGVMPFAAYIEPSIDDRPLRGLYLVTPSVDGDLRAMREHSWASIVNASVHEAYPGHHHQHAAALSAATPSRLLARAPEFVEGWGMYSEQLMLEEGFDDTPERRIIVATDAIWRATRIVLDIGLHRGEISVGEAIETLIEHTGFERPNATAEVHRYTRTPTYNLSYLLGKVLLLRLRADERRRLGPAFSLRAFHDALLYSGSIPVAFHRRLLGGEGGGPTPVGPAVSLDGGTRPRSTGVDTGRG
jgi:uncharacterized protein (DUF885 family)